MSLREPKKCIECGKPTRALTRLHTACRRAYQLAGRRQVQSFTVPRRGLVYGPTAARGRIGD
jgi:hypothetical protein